MNHISKLKLSPDLIHLIECLFRFEYSEKKSVTKEVSTILDCSIAYTSSLRKKWKKNNGSILNYQKKLKVTEEQAIAKKAKAKHFTSAKECKTCGNNIRYTSNRACIVCCTLPADKKEEKKEAALEKKKHQIHKLKKLHEKQEEENKPKTNFPSLPVINREDRIFFGCTFSAELENDFSIAKGLQRFFEKTIENPDIPNKEIAVSTLLEVPLVKARRIIKKQALFGKKYLIPKIQELLKAEQSLADLYDLKHYQSHISCHKCSSSLKYTIDMGCKGCMQPEQDTSVKNKLPTTIAQSGDSDQGQSKITRHA